MNETSSSKPSKRSPTPAPSFIDNSPPPEESSSESDAEHDALLRQVELYSRLLAERTMSEISAQDWVDLQSVHRMIYLPGNYSIQLPLLTDTAPSVRLVWTPGSLRLCAGLRPVEEDDTHLFFPSVTPLQEWPIPAVAAAKIPLPPTPLPPKTPASDPASIRYDELTKARNQAWEVACRPLAQEASRTMVQRQAQTEADEKRLAYRAAREIQIRRVDPEYEPGQTIAATMETIADQMRNALL